MHPSLDRAPNRAWLTLIIVIIKTSKLCARHLHLIMSSNKADRLAAKAGWVVHKRSFSGIVESYKYIGGGLPTTDKLATSYCSLIDALRTVSREHGDIVVLFFAIEGSIYMKISYKGK